MRPGLLVVWLLAWGLAVWLVLRWERRRPPVPRFPVERVNLDRRVRQGMLDELRGTGRKYSAKRLQKELRKQVRDPDSRERGFT